MNIAQISMYSIGEDPELWTQSFEQEAIKNGWNDKQKEYAFSTFVTPAIREWLFTQEYSNWRKLKNGFISHYKGTGHEIISMVELASAEKTNGNPELTKGTAKQPGTEPSKVAESVVDVSVSFSNWRKYVNSQYERLKQQFFIGHLYLSQLILLATSYVKIKYWTWKMRYYAHNAEMYKSIVKNEQAIIKQLFNSDSSLAWIKPSGTALDVVKDVISLAIELEVFRMTSSRQMLHQIAACIDVLTYDKIGTLLSDNYSLESDVDRRIGCERVVAIRCCLSEILVPLCALCPRTKDDKDFDVWFVDTSIIRLEQCQRVLARLAMCRTILQACRLTGPLQAPHRVLTQVKENPETNWKLVSACVLCAELANVKILSLLHLAQNLEEAASKIVQTKAHFDSRYYIYTKGYKKEGWQDEVDSILTIAYARNLLGYFKWHRWRHSRALKKAITSSNTCISLHNMEVPPSNWSTVVIYDTMALLAVGVDYRLDNRTERIVERRGGYVVSVKFAHITIGLVYTLVLVIAFTLSVVYNDSVRGNGIDPTSLTSLVALVLALILNVYKSMAAKDMTWWEFFKGEKVVYEIDSKQLLKWGFTLPGFIRYLRDDNQLAIRLLSSNQGCYLGYKLMGATKIMLPTTNKVLLAAGIIVAKEYDYHSPSWQRKTVLINLPNKLGRLYGQWNASWSIDVDKMKFARRNVVLRTDIWHTLEKPVKRHVAAKYIDSGNAIINGYFLGTASFVKGASVKERKI